MKIFERTVKYSLTDYKRNEEMFEDLKVAPFDDKLRGYKSQWLRRITRMNNNRMHCNAELQTKWKKMTWETSEGTI